MYLKIDRSGKLHFPSSSPFSTGAVCTYRTGFCIERQEENLRHFLESLGYFLLHIGKQSHFCADNKWQKSRPYSRQPNTAFLYVVQGMRALENIQTIRDRHGEIIKISNEVRWKEKAIENKLWLAPIMKTDVVKHINSVMFTHLC